MNMDVLKCQPCPECGYEITTDDLCGFPIERGETKTDCPVCGESVKVEKDGDTLDTSPLLTPYTVVIDTREQTPYSFAGGLSWGKRAPRLTVDTTRRVLSSGDYSLAGFEAAVAIERKTLADFFSTLGQGRARFQRELERLATMEFAAVMVEAEWSTIWHAPPRHSRLSPKSVVASVTAWQQRYPRVHWWMLPGRPVAEAMTLRILDRFWRDRQGKK